MFNHSYWVSTLKCVSRFRTLMGVSVKWVIIQRTFNGISNKFTEKTVKRKKELQIDETRHEENSHIVTLYLLIFPSRSMETRKVKEPVSRVHLFWTIQSQDKQRGRRNLQRKPCILIEMIQMLIYGFSLNYYRFQSNCSDINHFFELTEITRKKLHWLWTATKELKVWHKSK